MGAGVGESVVCVRLCVHVREFAGSRSRDAHELREHDGDERSALNEVKDALLVGLEGGLQEEHDDQQ